MSAPYEPGQKVTANDKRQSCPAPTCGSADLEFRAPGSYDGVFACTSCGESFIRRYADVTPVNPATGHAAGYPKAATPQTAPTPCPEWCEGSNHDRPAYGPDDHVSPMIGPREATPRPWIALREGAPSISFGSAYGLTAAQCRGIAAAIEDNNHESVQPAALREAADVLDRITAAKVTQ